MSTALVALDWGSSQLRAARLDTAGRVLEQRSSADGASRLTGGSAAFEQALRALAGDWLQPGAPVLACGMVGSAHGWREASYASCPIALQSLHLHLVAATGSGDLAVHIVPGLSTRGPGGQPDVMRGEETQLAGLLRQVPALAEGACVVLPGTHSKWVRVEQGRVAGFATRMTGELFALLREQSVLARLMAPGPADLEAFDRGVAVARAAGGADLAHWLFGVRALGLAGELAPTAAADYLSGLLIGAEVAAGLSAGDDSLPLALVGEAPLCERYARAFGAWGRTAQVHTEPLAATGLWSVAQAAGLA